MIAYLECFGQLVTVETVLDHVVRAFIYRHINLHSILGMHQVFSTVRVYSDFGCLLC